MLDDKGRCCGRKPIPYKRDRTLFCDRCDKHYSMDTAQQVQCWAWHETSPGVWARRAGYVKDQPVATRATPQERAE